MDYKKCFKYVCLVNVTCLTLFACGGGGSGGNDTTPTPQPPGPELVQESPAREYLDEVLNIMRANVVTRYEVDWGNLEAEVNSLAADAETISDTYPAINRALELLATNHSFLRSPSGELIAYPSNLDCQQNFEMDRPEEADIGYVRVDAITTSDSAQSRNAAIDIQDRIAAQDSPDVSRWIVDLRNNFGGNMYPMIAGLGPLFDRETLGHFIDANENVFNWGYANGAATVNFQPVLSVETPDYKAYSLLNALPKIAVLVSKRTASSGEATLIAFKKQYNVRTFGTDSCGVSTANQSFFLSDGSELILTVSIMADRQRQRYGGRVQVDQAVEPEMVLAEAVAWLRE